MFKVSLEGAVASYYIPIQVDRAAHDELEPIQLEHAAPIQHLNPPASPSKMMQRTVRARRGRPCAHSCNTPATALPPPTLLLDKKDASPPTSTPPTASTPHFRIAGNYLSVDPTPPSAAISHCQAPVTPAHDADRTPAPLARRRAGRVRRGVTRAVQRPGAQTAVDRAEHASEEGVTSQAEEEETVYDLELSTIQGREKMQMWWGSRLGA
ncbi:hypothetical protein B0H19DRAFT_1248209 [Mycena capillaripes]|nr:hypothetical protein B0H19DRAFT_1248209 [Mycena capillaripes]